MEPIRARPVSLLLPELLTRTRDILAGLGGGGSLTEGGPIVLDRLPEERVVDVCSEDVVELELGDLLSTQIDYVDRLP